MFIASIAVSTPFQQDFEKAVARRLWHTDERFQDCIDQPFLPFISDIIMVDWVDYKCRPNTQTFVFNELRISDDFVNETAQKIVLAFNRRFGDNEDDHQRSA